MNRTNAGGDNGERGPTLVTSNPRGYHTCYDTTSRVLSEVVIESIAAIRNVDPTATRIPLMEVVDPDALDALFADTYQGEERTDGHIVLPFDGLTVFAHSNGHVFVRETPNTVRH
ncbi:HalOD1 output domain-containing protein [Haladaptatus sp.]|uniref:HalOD1 output domain-containing protein n=1 Tax=Haladaptatus sp. TaxID=1973141 RepID=UPI003C3B777A